MKRKITLGVTSLALAGLVCAAPLFVGADYEAIPAEADVVHGQIAGAGITLAEAIEAAEKRGEGLAKSAAMTFGKDGKATVEVTVFGEASGQRIVVGADGQIISTTAVGGLPGAPVTGDATVTDSGLRYYDIVVGDGPKPSGPTSHVKVHYTGWLNDGTKFDSSVDRGMPATFPLNGVIRGWTEGVGDMTVGSKRKLVIPYALAYGASGRPPQIPPKATLVFDVELLSIEKD